MSNNKTVGIIGGSGLYEIEGLKDLRAEKLKTPWGNPSDAYMIGTLEETTVIFLPRHGKGHVLLPSELNHRANIYGFKMLGAGYIISVGAVGSLKEELKPRDIVVIDQFFDRTRRGREFTFFGDGMVAHISFADPVCGYLADCLYRSTGECGATGHRGGTYVNMEGPAFSTRAESHAYRKMGFDVIGMTNLPEAKLAREAEICYATMAMVTDYDCWHEMHEDVTVDTIVRIVQENAAKAKEIIRRTLPRIPSERTCGCRDALAASIITDKASISPAARKRLDVIIGKYIS